MDRCARALDCPTGSAATGTPSPTASPTTPSGPRARAAGILVVAELAARTPRPAPRSGRSPRRCSEAADRDAGSTTPRCRVRRSRLEDPPNSPLTSLDVLSGHRIQAPWDNEVRALPPGRPVRGPPLIDWDVQHVRFLNDIQPAVRPDVRRRLHGAEPQRRRLAAGRGPQLPGRHGHHHPAGRRQHDRHRRPPDGRDRGPPRRPRGHPAGHPDRGRHRRRLLGQEPPPRAGHPDRAGPAPDRRRRAGPAAQARAQRRRGRRRGRPAGRRRHRRRPDRRRPLHPARGRHVPGPAAARRRHRPARGLQPPRRGQPPLRPGRRRRTAGSPASSPARAPCAPRCTPPPSTRRAGCGSPPPSASTATSRARPSSCSTRASTRSSSTPRTATRSR